MCTVDVVPKKAIVFYGVPPDSVIGLPFFLRIENDLPDGLKIFCRLFAYKIKMGGKTVDFDLFQGGLDKPAVWAVQNAMLLSATQSHYLRF